MKLDELDAAIQAIALHVPRSERRDPLLNTLVKVVRAAKAYREASDKVQVAYGDVSVMDCVYGAMEDDLDAKHEALFSALAELEAIQ